MNYKGKTKLLVFLFVSLMFPIITSCSEEIDLDEEIIEMSVASSKATSYDYSWLIVRENNTSWSLFFQEIVGFNYEEGYEYLLKVRKVTRSLKSSQITSYELVEQLSKEKKTTVFYQATFTVSNNAHAEGTKLSPAEINEIESKIKLSSPFNGMGNITLSQTSFFLSVTEIRNGFYTANTGKTGNFSIETTNNDNKLYNIYKFEFDGDTIAYEYKPSSPTSSPYLILDVTDKYKAEYSNLEIAQSVIGMRINR